MQNKIICQDEFINTEKGSGFIYIVSNKTYPGLIKIEKALTIPAVKSVRLYSKEGTSEFLEYVQLVPQNIEMEAWIQRELEQYRDASNPKFFRLQTYKAIKIIQNVIAKYQPNTDKTIKFRTKIHARWAMFFNILEVPFEYMTSPIYLGPEMHYLPEFWLPEQDCWMIIRKDLFNYNKERLMAWALSRYTEKVVFAFYDCKKGISENINVNSKPGTLNDCHMGQFLTPKGDRDGLMEWGICDQCGSKNIGCYGLHELCYHHKTNAPDAHPKLIEAFNLVNKS